MRSSIIPILGLPLALLFSILPSSTSFNPSRHVLSNSSSHNSSSHNSLNNSPSFNNSFQYLFITHFVFPTHFLQSSPNPHLKSLQPIHRFLFHHPGFASI